MSAVDSSILCRRAAMNTWFEIILAGDDTENLHALGEAALDEIQRVEKLLSRFDPASEVTRINRCAASVPVRVDLEMAEILETCRSAWKQTEGFFDITANPGVGSRFDDLIWDGEQRQIAFAHPQTRLDFGGFGKGHALDCAALFLREYGVKKALLHGGTSSVLAIGSGLDDNPWPIGLRLGKEAAASRQIELLDEALSTSGTGDGVSDLIDPHTHSSIQEVAMCSVISSNAAQAEIYSTALLCMGKQRAQSFLTSHRPVNLKVLWNDTNCLTVL